ncbi:alpha/beta fold hydrolase [Pseudonocardia alni]|uniref:alpha/beta fold hydrolase n=1 Tax=Pseudonocardia alni TaxID=33907 RepID=UPI00280B1A98|nr:alpha/beta hydrolase [Pseudonocardia alni]
MNAFTTSDGCTLDYRVDGPGSAERTLVLLHGWSQSRAMFDRIIPALAERYRVISYDQRGHGESAKPATGARVARLAADLHELLDHLDVGSADVLGHSMGSSVLWSYIDHYGTGRFSSFVVLDQPSACVVLPWMNEGEGKEAGAILDFTGAEQFAAGLLGPDEATVRRSFLTSMLTQDIPADDLEWMYAENCKLPADFGAKLLVDHVMQDWRDLLPGIDVPTLVIGGEVSHVDPASQKWTASRIPGSVLKVFTRAEGGAHFPFFEAPEPFVAALRDFIDSVPAGA